MMRHTLLGGVLLVICVTFAFARQGLVRTKDGRTLEGDVIDRASEGVTITTKAGTITLSRDDVATVEYADSVRELYKQRVKALPKDAGAKAHMELARWLYDAREYELAHNEVEAALLADPNNPEAAMFKQTIEKAIAWERTKPPAAAGGTKAPVTKPSPASLKDRHLLDADQINNIRQGELLERSVGGVPVLEPVRVRLDKDVARRYVDYVSGDIRNFSSLPDLAKAMVILKDGTPDMRSDVRILTDPLALSDFKTKIQPAVLAGCGTVACHGGANAGKFVLYSPADTDAVTYTNFYILTQFNSMVTDDTGDKIARRPIERSQPTDSLLVQYGLPAANAKWRHPEVQGFAPMFRGTQDPRYQQIVAWMRGLRSIEPKYNITFTLPSRAVQPPPPPATLPAK